MFCDGQCKKDNKICGLFYGIILQNNITGSIENIEKCAFHHIADSFMRLEQGNIKLQAAVESSRNEQANSDHKMSSIVATGFIGMLHAFNENPEKFKKSLKILNSVAISENKLLDNKG